MPKNALVIGGDRGIGRACALALSEAGYQVFFTCHTDTASAEQTALDIQKNGGQASWTSMDVSDTGQVHDGIRRFLQYAHAMDTVVYASGISLIRLFTDTEEEEWQRILDVNLSGAYRVLKEALPSMIERKQGSVILISSMWGEVGASCEVAYSASKAALIGMTKALAKELGPSGIRVNCITPGVIRTRMNDELGAETLSALAEETPLSRIGEPEDVGKAAAFLSSPSASFITGQVLGVSGGFCI